MSWTRKLKPLAQFLGYVLGRRPDEFGLIPDAQGYVKIKELLKALCEVEGWRFVRAAHLKELVLSLPDAPIEIKGSTVRAKDRTKLVVPVDTDDLPKLLFTCVRRKAHSVVLTHGIHPGVQPFIVLACERSLAQRLGQRIDAQPVLLTVIVAKARQAGIRFKRIGEVLYLTEGIPPGCFTAPPLPKLRQDPPQKSAAPAEHQPTPGSFLLSGPPTTTPGHGKGKGRKKEIAWKRERRRGRRQKKIDKV